MPSIPPLAANGHSKHRNHHKSHRRAYSPATLIITGAPTSATTSSNSTTTNGHGGPKSPAHHATNAQAGSLRSPPATSSGVARTNGFAHQPHIVLQSQRHSAGRIRTTSLTLNSSGAPVVVPPLPPAPPRGTDRNREVKKRGAGRAAWGSIEDELRHIQHHSAAEFVDDSQVGLEEEDDVALDEEEVGEELARSLNSPSRLPAVIPHGHIVFSVLAPELSVEDITSGMRPAVEDYLQHGDTREVVTVATPLNFGANAWALVALILQLGIEHNVRQLGTEVCSSLSFSLYSLLTFSL